MTGLTECVYAVNTECRKDKNPMSAVPFTLSDMPRKPLPESEKRVPASTRLPPKLFNALMDLAVADDRKLAYMLEKAVREYVERHGAKARKPK